MGNRKPAWAAWGIAYEICGVARGFGLDSEGIS